MTRQEVINTINKACQNQTIYAESLAKAINTMQPHQQEYFLDQVAPYYLFGPGKQPYDMMYKDLEYMARAVAKDRDVSNILGIDYRLIGQVLHSLPTLDAAQNSQHHKAPMSDEEIIKNANRIIDKHVLHMGEGNPGVSNQYFCQSNNVNYNSMPLQGWKFHISANDLKDYAQLLEKVCPEFDRLGIAYKVVRPEMFQQQMEGPQAGKAITVYPTPSFDITNFSKEMIDALSKDSVCPNGDACIAGRIHARYGRFRSGIWAHELVAPDGSVFTDPRHSAAAPAFVSENSASQILNFYSDCAQRYQQTGDYKSYLQEMATMTKANSESNAFITLQIDKEKVRNAEQVIKSCTSGHSFIYSLDGQQTFAMLHKDEADMILHSLNEQCIEYERPLWDRRYNVYAIDSVNLDIAIAVVDQFNSNRTISECSPQLAVIQLGDDEFGLLVDTSLNNNLMDLCQAYNLDIYERIENVTEYDLYGQANEERDSIEIDDTEIER